MKNSIAHKEAIIWNTLEPELNDTINTVRQYSIMAKQSKALYNLVFSSTSPQTMHRTGIGIEYYSFMNFILSHHPLILVRIVINMSLVGN